MSTLRHKVEEIINKLREPELLALESLQFRDYQSSLHADP